VTEKEPLTAVSLSKVYVLVFRITWVTLREDALIGKSEEVVEEEVEVESEK